MSKQMPISWVEKWEAQFKENTISLCVFLKLLWEQTRDNPKKLSMHELMKGLKIPHGDELLPILQEKGILHKEYLIKSANVIASGCKYQWISKTEPNTKMAEALLKLVHERRRASKHKELWRLNIKSIGLFY